MAVTPKGIVTPDASSPYNLIPDLNTLASTADAAISTQKGSSTQRTTALAGAPEGTLWQDTDGIKMIWRKDGSAWVPAVWRWAGTTAQMNAFTQAPNGFQWFDVSTSTSFLRLGASWRSTAPVGGNVTVTTSSSAGATVNVTLPAGRFSAPPYILVTKTAGTGAKHVPYVSNITTSGFTLGVYSGDGTTSSSPVPINWVAFDAQ